MNHDFNANPAKKVRLIHYIEQNFSKIIHDVALAIERHNAMPTLILAVLL